MTHQHRIEIVKLHSQLVRHAESMFKKSNFKYLEPDILDFQATIFWQMLGRYQETSLANLLSFVGNYCAFLCNIQFFDSTILSTVWCSHIPRNWIPLKGAFRGHKFCLHYDFKKILSRTEVQFTCSLNLQLGTLKLYWRILEEKNVQTCSRHFLAGMEVL